MKPLAWLASFRLRILYRTSFLLLALAVVAMAVAVLQEEQQRSYDNYQASFAKTKEQICLLYTSAPVLAGVRLHDFLQVAITQVSGLLEHCLLYTSRCV